MMRLDPEAWSRRVEALLERVRPQLVRTLKSYRIPVLEGEDLVQGALLALVTKWSEIREPESWLVGALRHQCRVYVRRESGRKMVPADRDEMERLAGAAPSGEERIDARIDLERLAGSLEPRQRQLLWRSVGLGLDERELARVLGGVKPASLARARRRAIGRLRGLVLGGGLGGRKP